jgi:cobalamin biosynthesis protein CobD/CbiB
VKVSKKDRTPAEIAEARARREQRRMLWGMVVWLVWLALFTVGYVLHSVVLGWFGVALCIANLAMINGMHEKLLRKIAGRPQVDYNRLRKLQERELPERDRKGT